MLRKAVLEDIPQIMDIIKVSILEMHSNQNYQWDENYPQIIDFQADIEAENLYVFVHDGNLAAFICVNYVEPDEYSNLKWSSPQKGMVIHRMSVHPEYRRTGIGSELMKFAEILARSKCSPYIRTDTNSQNEKMKTLFTKFGYTFTGEVNFPGKEHPFYCYDKILD